MCNVINYVAVCCVGYQAVPWDLCLTCLVAAGQGCFTWERAWLPGCQHQPQHDKGIFLSLVMVYSVVFHNVTKGPSLSQLSRF